jgi:hypothetical protein
MKSPIVDGGSFMGLCSNMKTYLKICLLLMLAISCGENGGNAPGTATEETCAGNVVGGFCWYLASNVSCDSICATHGGYNEATRSYAGSDGTDANCRDVADALGIPGTTVTVVTPDNGFDGWGCISDNGIRLRHQFPTNSTANSAGVARACACNE